MNRCRLPPSIKKHSRSIWESIGPTPKSIAYCTFYRPVSSNKDNPDRVIRDNFGEES